MNRSHFALAGWCDPTLIHRMAPVMCIHSEYLRHYGRPADLAELNAVLKWHSGDRWY